VIVIKALGPIQTLIHWVAGALSLGVKRLGSEADRSPPSSAEIKNAWSYTSTSPIRLHGVVQRDNFTFTFRRRREVERKLKHKNLSGEIQGMWI
jgi:hypothetical protein